MTELRNKTMLNEKQVAEMMRVNPESLRVRRMRKQPPIYYKIGGKVLYDLEDIEAFLKLCKVMPQEEGNKDE